jgi:hypothetical protein
MSIRHSIKAIHHSAVTIVSNRIVHAVLKGMAFYFSFTFLFALLYYLFDSLDFKFATAGAIHFFDYIYFSAVTFTTIGYGDIVPKEGAGQVIVLIESCFELAFFPVFGGYLAYKFFLRPNDILLTDNFFIRYRNQRISLSQRVGNKGKNLLDCSATIEFIQIVNNVKRTLYRHEISTPLIEFVWYLEIRLDGDENSEALLHVKTLLAKPDSSMIRTTVTGYDSGSGNLVHIFKYYTMDKLTFGGKFSDVYSWEGVERTEPDWSHFNKVVSLSSAEHQIIDKLMQQ